MALILLQDRLNSPAKNLDSRQYKRGIAGCDNPVGEFVNDNVMITNAVLCYEDRNKARALALDPRRGYLLTLVQLYHDTFPHRPGYPTWPGIPPVLKAEALDPVVDSGLMLCGNPEEVIEQLRIYERTGVDQVSFGIPGSLAYDDALELIETFGRSVIPEFDKDPTHSTSRYRAQARPKFAPFNDPPAAVATLYNR
jgi:hypothetical protein